MGRRERGGWRQERRNAGRLCFFVFRLVPSWMWMWRRGGGAEGGGNGRRGSVEGSINVCICDRGGGGGGGRLKGMEGGRGVWA